MPAGKGVVGLSGITSCIAIYNDLAELSVAVESLHTHGFDMRHVSVVGKGGDVDKQVGMYCGDGVPGFYGEQKLFWNDLWASLDGAALFWVPGYGSIVAAGSIVELMARGRDELHFDGGFGILGSALYRLAVPRGSIFYYEKTIRVSRVLLIAHGSRHEVEQAGRVLEQGRNIEIAVHAA